MQDSVTRIDRLSEHDSDSRMVFLTVEGLREGQYRLNVIVGNGSGLDVGNGRIDRRHGINNRGFFGSRFLW